MELLKQVYRYVCDNSVDSLYQFMEDHKNDEVSDAEFEQFTNMFAAKEKEWLQGCINIHGMGGTGIGKVNLTSIACLYLSVISDLPIAKTGSTKNTGVFGSTDLFDELKFTKITDKKSILEEYGFVYFDYLELSPWKQYKPLLKKNRFIADIFDRYHFFEYSIGTLGLGISSQSTYSDYLARKKYPAPKQSFVYYSNVNGTLIDECVNTSFVCDFSKKVTAREIIKADYDLIYGNDKGSYWYWALRESVAFFAKELGAVQSLEEGKEAFERAYTDKKLASVISDLNLKFHIRR